jgi:hypothetical protein
MLVYETAQPVPQGRRGSSALARLERRVVSQRALRARDYLWKTYSAGSLRDDAFLARLEVDDRLRAWIRAEPKSQYGFQRAKRGERAAHPPSRTLRDLRSLATFESWGPLRDEWFETVPSNVKFVPDERLFHGRRLIVRRGVSPGFGPHARLETEPFAFRHTTYAVSLDHLSAWQAKVVLGTLLSSLGRYWLYMVSGSWGTWRDDVRSEDLLDLPLRLTSASDPATKKIVRAVDSLRRRPPQQARGLWDPRDRQADSTKALREVDDGVGDLFELTMAERDLVADFWAGQAKDATRPVVEHRQTSGTAASLGRGGLRSYLATFLSAWNRHLEDTGELSWRVHRDSRAHVIAAVFETRALGSSSSSQHRSEEEGSWSAALERLGVQLERRQTKSLLRYGMIRAVSNTAIIIVKSDEQRLWTATAAREDADATTAQVMALEQR